MREVQRLKQSVPAFSTEDGFGMELSDMDE
jgi:hypothetical protein